MTESSFNNSILWKSMCYLHLQVTRNQFLSRIIEWKLNDSNSIFIHRILDVTGVRTWENVFWSCVVVLLKIFIFLLPTFSHLFYLFSFFRRSRCYCIFISIELQKLGLENWVRKQKIFVKVWLCINNYEKNQFQMEFVNYKWNV